MCSVARGRPSATRNLQLLTAARLRDATSSRPAAAHLREWYTVLGLLTGSRFWPGSATPRTPLQTRRGAACPRDACIVWAVAGSYCRVGTTRLGAGRVALGVRGGQPHCLHARCRVTSTSRVRVCNIKQTPRCVAPGGAYVDMRVTRELMCLYVPCHSAVAARRV